MATLIPVDHDPFADGPKFIPVDGDPFKGEKVVPVESKGFVASALEPITSYPETYAEMNRAGRERIGEGYTQSAEALTEPRSGGGAVKLAKGVGNMALGAVETVASPINAAYRTIVGRPIEAVTGIPKEYTELGAQLVTPGIGLTRLATRVQKPLTPPVAQPGAEVAAAGERLGVDLPRAVTSDSTAVQQVGKGATAVPIGGAPLINASKQAITDLGEAATAARAAYGSGEPALAGVAAREGITQAIRSGPIKQRVTELYDRVDGLVNPTVTGPMPNTRNLVSNIDARRKNAAMPESSATKELGEALSRSGMNYEGIKDLRTYFGEMRDGNIPIPQGMTDTEVKQIYGALSTDMRLIIARAGGADGLRVFDQANRAAARWAGIREDLGKILKVQNEEAIFDKIAAMAGSTARANISLLGRVRGAVGPQNWDEVSSAVIAKMGWPPWGTGFSPDAFLTAYKKMSEEGKRMLFRSTGNADHADAIDDIAKVSERFKELNKFANPSGTGQTSALTTLLTAAGSVVSAPFVGIAALTGPLIAVGTITGTRILSHILARPVTARQMANWSNAYASVVIAPTPKSLGVFEAASKTFAASVGRDFGRPDLVDTLMRKLQQVPALQAPGIGRTEDNQQPIPGIPAQ